MVSPTYGVTIYILQTQKTPCPTGPLKEVNDFFLYVNKVANAII